MPSHVCRSCSLKRSPVARLVRLEGSVSVAEVVAEAVGEVDTTRPLDRLGVFTATPRMLVIAGLAICIGIVSTYVAKVLLALINLFTNIFFFQRWSAAAASPAMHSLGWLVIVVPVI